MPKPAADPPFPNSPGAWVACCRYRLKAESGRAVSPEQLGDLLGCSGATVRRWEANRSVPSDKDLRKLGEVCRLTPMQSIFLSLAYSHIREMPPPPAGHFRSYLEPILQQTDLPAMVFDSLLYHRAWNTYVDALGTGMARALAREVHPIAMLLRMDATRLSMNNDELEEQKREGVRRFWMTTAILCYRPEYAELLRELDKEPDFRRHWLAMALDDSPKGMAPLMFAQDLEGGEARFRVFQTSFVFPPRYFLYEFMPINEAARNRLMDLQAKGPAALRCASRISWLHRQPGSS